MLPPLVLTIAAPARAADAARLAARLPTLT